MEICKHCADKIQNRGVFGLGTQPVNYSTLGNISAPSYISTLKDQNLIPALGWSYTAGAQYSMLTLQRYPLHIPRKA